MLLKIGMINLYYAFIFPYPIYCVEVWGNVFSIHTQPLIKLQNKIIMMITNSHFLASSDWGLVSFILGHNYIFN